MMACTQRRFFGVPLVEQTTEELAESWGAARSQLSALIFADRMLLWRIARSRITRQYLLDVGGRVVPNGRGPARQVRVATGCRVGAFQEFQSVVRVMARAEADGATVYLVGRSQDQLQRVEQNVRATFPQLRVVGRAVFHVANMESITTAIRKAGPRIVFVGSDAPILLRWMREHSNRFGPVLTLIAFRAAQRMAGKPASPRSGVWAAHLARPFMGAPLIAHRLWAHYHRNRRSA
jgi:N-acetylglucosaminyldiphosphoundecaprenol N-acetyl-beta-D-mannosaminyltransferase